MPFFDACLAAVILGAGSWYFASVRWLGYYDSWLVLALLVVAFGRARWTVWLACLWAPWVDERFVLAVPLALLCRWLVRSRGGEPATWGAFWRRELAGPAGLIVAFMVVRLGWLPRYSVRHATISGYLDDLNLHGTPWTRVALGIWEGLRVAWILVAAAIWLLARRRGQAATLGAAVLGLVVVGLGTAQDFSRSMMLVLPVALLGALLAFETRPRWLPLTLRLGAGVALLAPAHLVMSNAVSPIAGLKQELAGLDSPPPAIMPQLYELRGVHDMERGDFAQAEKDLTLAIKLNDDPTDACKQRGVLYASAGRWADAQRDFDRMVKHQPANPDGWFLRAQAELALDEASAAQADFRQALAVAPDGWTDRPDVKRFRDRLRQKAGGGPD